MQQSTIEQDLTQAFTTILNNYNFDKNQEFVKEISQMFGINLESLKEMSVQ